MGEASVAILVEKVFNHRFKKNPILARGCALLGLMA